MNDKIISILLVLILAVMATAIVYQSSMFSQLIQKTETNLGYAGYNDLGYDGMTHATTSIAASIDDDGSDNTILSANAALKYARIECASGTTYIFLDKATSTLEVNAGIQLDAGEYYEITPDNLYFGQVMGIASTETSTVYTVYK